MRFVLRNRGYLMGDIVGWALLPWLALALRLDGFQVPRAYVPDLTALALLAIPVKFLAFWRFGLYRRYWRYASIEEFALMGAAVAIAGAALWVIYVAAVVPWTPSGVRLPRSLPVLDALLTLVYAGGTRSALRLMDHIRVKARGAGVRERVLIVGAGAAGTMLARQLRASPQLGLEPVGFVDDNPAKLGSVIQGAPVLGGRRDIADIAQEYAVSRVVIAMPAAPGEVIREIRDLCDQAKLRTKILPGVHEIISGRISVNQLRDVQIDDLLRRPPVRTDQRAVADLVNGMTVLVTGAGGSIGSEICRQVAGLGARELVLLGHGENSIFEVYHELLAKFPGVQFIPVIGDIRDSLRVNRIFDTYNPQAVFHAAAHKHVPLMELNPEEAVTNNVVGTSNVVSASVATGVSRFVFISTDKAVNPGNVMGATKLLAERLVHDAAERTGAPYVSVRFGNVLGSRGSVVPLFKRQIEAGGPVTVTHPDVTRYFMTIPEAVQLVLQAAALGRGGETFVLDMGEPVKVTALAEDLIRLSGLEVGKDISVVFTGLRPGEKLSEQLFSDGEEAQRTEHEKIFIVRNGRSSDSIAPRIGDLLKAVELGDHLRLRHLLSELVAGKPGERLSAPPSTDAAAQAGRSEL